MTVRILIGDVRDKLAELADESVHCVVTSPPYWGLRDYGVEGQIGLEATPDQYIATMIVHVFREVRRVMRKDATLWLNMGDSYASSPSGSFDSGGRGSGMEGGEFRSNKPFNNAVAGLKPKDLCMMPARLALALQADGWWLRSEIIWAKPNPMPESVTDRPTSAHEKVYLLTKSARYFYDAEAVRTPAVSVTAKMPDGWDTGAGAHGTVHRQGREKGRRTDKQRGHGRRHDGFNDRWDGMEKAEQQAMGANLRNVWNIATQPYPDAHFATFPTALVEPCIKAGTSEKGCCPECGAPWRRETTTEYRKNRPSAGNDPRSRSDDKQAHGSLGGHHGWQGNNLLADVHTIGWWPSCGCAGDLSLACISGTGLPILPDESIPIPCTVLDPFAGSGTTGLVADRLGRDAILIELNPEYAAMAEKRLHKDAGLFAEVATA